jgi:sterol desaturase/sphingolipid hydroxylase (fatty acid hydroxylase superfamily)
MTTSKRPSGVPAHELWPREAAKGRARLYPPTILYTAYSTAVLALALRTPHRVPTVFFFGLGAALWTLLEYFVHRKILHGRFPDSPSPWRHFLHVRFDHLHWEHHERPWDGEHINGRIQDTILFSLVFVAVAAFFPVWTAPVMVAGLLQAYVIEEWVHHSVHFYHFQNPYFRYIKRHHLYHHSPKGDEVGYGLTNGFWDIVFATRIPTEQRRLLYRGRGGEPERPMTEVGPGPVRA